MARRTHLAHSKVGGVMYLFGTILLGIVVGTLWRFLISPSSSPGLLVHLVAGVGGALALYYGGVALHAFPAYGGAPAIAAVIGALALIGAMRGAMPTRVERVHA